jgi:hypothetical protein
LVTLPGVGTSGGVVHVTAYGQTLSGGSCRPVAWRPTPSGAHADEQVEVACADRTGAPAELPFDLLFLAGTEPGPYSAGGERGWVRAGQPTTSSYLPSARDEDGAGRVTRTGRGHYTVALSPAARAVQITAAGAAPGTCTLDGLGGGSASVLCMAPDGAAADLPFNLSYTGRESLLGDSRVPHGAYLSVIESAGGANPPAVAGQWLSRGGSATVARTAAGQYEIHLPLGYLPSYTHVTGHGRARCGLVLRNDYSRMDGTVLRVACAVPGTAAGAATGFDLTYMTASPYEHF